MFLQKQNRIVGKFWNTSIIPTTKRNYEFTQVARHNLAFHVWSLSIYSFRTKKGGRGED